jgi:hypothetical protein
MDTAVYTIAGALGGVLLGSGLSFFGQRSLAGQRERTERKLAHDARIYAKRSIVYEELLIARAKQLTTAAQMYPMAEFGESPERPTGLSMNDSIELVARAHAVISPEVRAADDAMSKAFHEFRGMVASHVTQHLQKTGEKGIDQDAYPIIEKQRELVAAAYEKLASAIRFELTEPPSWTESPPP